MTELKREVLMLIDGIPEENFDMLTKIRNNIRELLGIKLRTRSEKNLAIIQDVKDLIGDDVPWANEEAMIQDLAEMRRQCSKS